MERKLFLTSAGLQKETKDYFLKLLLKKPKDTIVAFIPTAAYPEVDQSFVHLSLDELKEVGITKIKKVDLINKDKNSLLKELKDCDVIYVNGGNTFYLLDWIRKSGFNEIIGNLLDKGKIYMGVSAGSYVASPNIDVATWKNQDNNFLKLKDLNSLNLVPFLIMAHFEEKYRNIVEENAPKTKYPLIVLTDKQAITCIGDKYEIAGEGEEIKYNF